MAVLPEQQAKGLFREQDSAAAAFSFAPLGSQPQLPSPEVEFEFPEADASWQRVFHGTLVEISE